MFENGLKLINFSPYDHFKLRFKNHFEIKYKHGVYKNGRN